MNFELAAFPLLGIELLSPKIPKLMGKQTQGHYTKVVFFFLRWKCEMHWDARAVWSLEYFVSIFDGAKGIGWLYTSMGGFIPQWVALYLSGWQKNLSCYIKTIRITIDQWEPGITSKQEAGTPDTSLLQKDLPHWGLLNLLMFWLHHDCQFVCINDWRSYYPEHTHLKLLTHHLCSNAFFPQPCPEEVFVRLHLPFSRAGKPFSFKNRSWHRL